MSQTLVPSYNGFIGSTKDAVLVIQGVLSKEFPLVERRPLDRERKYLIKLGLVFVFIEERLGIKRWTDGIAWSASRILGRFLVYRELDHATLNEKEDKRKRRKHSDCILLTSRESLLDYTAQASHSSTSHHAYSTPGSTPYMNSYSTGLVVASQSRNVYKDRVLIKKTLSVTTTTRDVHFDSKDEKQTIHLILYYLAHDVLLGKLIRPSQLNLRHMPVAQLLWDSVKRLSLGGKIPAEDEAYYFLDLNYQLQNMSVLVTQKETMRMLQSHPLSKLPYVLPVPYQGPAPPLAFQQDYVPQMLQPVTALPFRQGQHPNEAKKEYDDSSFSAPFNSHSTTYPSHAYHSQYDHQDLAPHFPQALTLSQPGLLLLLALQNPPQPLGHQLLLLLGQGILFAGGHEYSTDSLQGFPFTTMPYQIFSNYPPPVIGPEQYVSGSGSGGVGSSSFPGYSSAPGPTGTEQPGHSHLQPHAGGSASSISSGPGTLTSTTTSATTETSRSFPLYNSTYQSSYQYSTPLTRPAAQTSQSVPNITSQELPEEQFSYNP